MFGRTGAANPRILFNLERVLVRMQGDIWSKTGSEVCKEVESTPLGLSSAEAKTRLGKYGHNEIPDKDKKEWFEILASQFASPLLLILIFASFVSVYLGEVFDTIIILVIVVASVLPGFAQEYKSEKVLAQLKRYFSYKAVVLRNGGKV